MPTDEKELNLEREAARLMGLGFIPNPARESIQEAVRVATEAGMLAGCRFDFCMEKYKELLQTSVNRPTVQDVYDAVQHEKNTKLLL